MNQPWQAALDAAIARRHAGEAAAALADFLALAAAWPDTAVVHYHTAWCHDLLGQEAEAVPFYERALALGLDGKDRAGAYLGLGSTLRTLGQHERALAVLTAGVAAFPEDRGLLVFQAMARYNTGQAKDAVSQLLTLLVATTTDPDIRQYARAIALYAEDLDRTWS
jgi:tetratricopeptide (TPR) repeat protein